MIEQLLKVVRKVSDKAEIYSLDNRGDTVSFENGHLKDIDGRIQSGVSLRIIKNNVLGFSYTKNLTNREELVQNALDSLKGGVEGLFELPLTRDLPSLDTYDPSIETLSNSAMVEECNRVCEFLSRRTKGQINITAFRTMSRLRIVNSSKTDLSLKSSAYFLHTAILYPYSSASLHRTLVSKTFKEADDEYLNFLADTYNQSMKGVNPGGRKMKVLFLPETMYVLMWRLQTATSGRSIYQNISPVADKIDERIFDEKLCIYNDPLNDALPGARVFDDEGIPCRYSPVIENGILRNFYYDLYFAGKLKAFPTGHGFKGSVSSKPAPLLAHLCIMPGNKSFSDLLQAIDSGIIVAGALGAHSGNIPHGDFSIGVSPGLYVEKGKIVGHVKDVMVAGNIYETLKNVVGIENTLHPCFGGNFPCLLFDNISVTTKK
jgi:PmbA protein